jgi:cytochrome c-type biogenesis protein CcmH/NrfG
MHLRHETLSSAPIRCDLCQLSSPLCLTILLIGCASTPYYEADWIEIRTADLTLISNTTEERTLEIALALERFRALVAPLTGASRISPTLPTRVFVFNDRDWVKHFGLPRRLDGVALVRTDACFLAIYARSGLLRSPLTTVFHEYTHFLMSNQSRAPHYPKWYAEGLASALSTVKFERDYVTVGLIPGIVMRSFKESPWFSMKLLMTTNGYFVDPWADSALYAHAWLFVHRLTWGQMIGFEDRNGQMLRYLARVSRGDDIEQAFHEEFGATFQEMDAELSRYARSHPPTIRVDVQELTDDFEPTVRMLSAAESLRQLARFQLARDESGAPEAERLSRRALELAPGDPSAVVLLARSLAVQGKPIDHEALERAVNQEPHDPEIVLGAAEAYLEQLRGSKAAPSGDEELARHIKELFERGITLAPEFPSGYFGLGQILLLENDRTNAALAFESALERARNNVEIEFALGKLYVELGLNERASILLREVAGASHEEDVRDEAEAILDQLESEPGAPERGVSHELPPNPI